MNERKKKLEGIFHGASELTSREQREGYLDEACQGDADLRREVDALLKAAAAGEALFQPFEERASHASAIEVIREQAGSVIGRYKLLEKIGEGGMGVVYMAEQEEPVRRKVALKIIKLGMDTKQVVARFEAERQALAMMDHPHIAQVLDGGATDSPLTLSLSPDGGEGARRAGEGDVGYPRPSDGRGAGGKGFSAGRPYFVMELVQGVPITEFCDANQLSIEERLKLFIPVCDAIQSAHQKGIIHRDIKPSNVLVTLHNGVPHPMVIDFGVARAINQKLTEKTLFTNFATMIGTPAYMSPEQAEMSKLDVDTRSDIYALGVLLYELLTGSTPFPEERLRSVAYGEMQRIIAEEEPERPSTRLKKQGIAPSPRPSPPLGERVSEGRVRGTSDIDSDLDWIVMKCLEKDRNRRYETANGLATDIKNFLGNEPVLARAPSAAYRFQKLVRRNKLQFAAVAIVASVLIVASVVSSWQAVIARRERRAAQTQAEIARSVKEFLTEQLLSANPYVAPELNPNRRALLEQAARALEGKFANQPAVEAEIRYALESGFSGLADATNALAQGQRLLELRRRTLGPTHSDTLESMAYVALHCLDLGRRKEAEMVLDEGMRASNASSPELSLGAAFLAFARGRLLREDGRAAEALPYMRKALPVLIRTLKPTDHRLIIARWSAALITQEAGQTEEAERLWAEGIRHFERELGADHPATAQFQKGQAYAFLERGRWREAMELLERAVATYHRSLGTNHNNVLDAEDLLARAHEQKGDIEPAAKIYASTYPRWVKHFPYPSALVHCNIIANFFVRHRRYEQAKAVFSSLRESFAANPPNRSQDFDRLIAATAAVDGWPAVAEMCRKYFDRFANLPSVCRTIGTVFLYVGDEDGYRKVTTKAIALAPATTDWQDQLAILHIAARGPFAFLPEQERQCQALIQSVERALSSVAPGERTRAHRAIGALQLRFGKLTNGLAHLESAVQTAGEPSGRARTLLLKALCLHRLDRAEEAHAAFSAAEAIMKPSLLDRLTESEGFLTDADRYDILLHRESQALLGGAQSKP